MNKYNVNINLFGHIYYEPTTVYEPWIGQDMEGERGQLGKFEVGDYTTLWR